MKFSVLSDSLEKMESTTKRIELTDILVELLKNTHANIISKVIYLIQGKIRPNFEGVELGIAEKLAMKAISKSTGITIEKIIENYTYSCLGYEKKPKKCLFTADTAVEWIDRFIGSQYDGVYDFWVQGKEEDKEYTGYDSVRGNKDFLDLETGEMVTHSTSIKERTFLYLTKDELISLNLSSDRLTNIPELNSSTYWLRLYKKENNRLFPSGLKAFRISWCQYAVNFPPLTAKYLYEKYTDSGKLSNIWDPSAGWGGRILGAMAI